MSSSSPSYKQFAHLKIPLEDIISATDNFSDANLIRTDGFGNEYKGQLSRSGQLIDIVARRLDNKYGLGNKEFWTEVSMLSALKHENLVSIVGFCDENGEKIVINEHETRGSLDKYLTDTSLTWGQRVSICVDVARALSYIYYDEGRDFSVIHRDIKSSKILLNDDRRAKLSGFELSINQVAAGRNRLCPADVCGTLGYCDPTYLESGSVSHKSDIYSLGIVLFQVLCGKEAVTEDNRSLAPLVKSRYDEGTLDELIDPDLLKQMDPQSFNIFSKTAYYCLKEQRSERPDIDQILEKLLDAFAFQCKHEESLQRKDLEHLKIPLVDIESATNNFAQTHRIASGSYGEVYKAELYNFYRKKFLEENSKDEVPRKCSVVAVKRLNYRVDLQGENRFHVEIETLTRCKHPNIVSLVGFCDEGSHMILVYELASNGSLDDYVVGGSNKTNLTWVQCLKICIDVAHALNYLHTYVHDVGTIIHRNIKSASILLGENGVAKIGNFGFSKFCPKNLNNTLYLKDIAGTQMYMEPEYENTGKLTDKSDIYSFGVVLLEVMCGKFANDPIYTKENSNGIAPVAWRRFFEGTIREMVDPRFVEETHGNIFTLNRGSVYDSLDAFSKIACQCVAETQEDRPSAEIVIKKLEEALSFQENMEDNLKIPLEDIKLVTDNFSELIGRGRFGRVYKGRVTYANEAYFIAVKRLDKSRGQGENGILTELQILLEYKHENIIGLVGYCNEISESIIVYDYASRGSLDTHLKDNYLTWTQRLKICIDVASGLHFLHGGSEREEVVIHRDIKSTNVLLDDDWKAKICDFRLSLKSPINKNMDFVTDNACGTLTYCDPLYMELGFLTRESDIYSLGVVLVEILLGRLISDQNIIGDFRFVIDSFKCQFEKGKLDDEMVFEGMREQIAPNSLAAFHMIAYECLQRERGERPTAEEVLLRLRKALELQEDHEMWEPRLPKDYMDIIQMSNHPEIYFTSMKKDLYNMLSKGILIQQGKVVKELEHLKIPLIDIKSATDNFSQTHVIGYGSYCKVYKAEVYHFDRKKFLEEKSNDEVPRKRSAVAMKRLNYIQEEHEYNRFHAEIEKVASCNHPNIVSLLGFCEEDGHMILVYEHASNGNLDDYWVRGGSITNLTWVQRIKICIDVARALNYLHTNVHIIHRDIRSASILLGGNWEAKIANFDLSVFCPKILDNTLYLEDIAGTQMYLDPEYQATGKLTDKSDIYSFGVVLLEVMSGKVAYDPIYTTEHKNGIAPVARRRFSEGTIREMVDPRFMEETHGNIFTLNRGPDRDSLDAFSKIACQCVAQTQEDRPSAEVVVKKLEEALSLQENTKDRLKISLEDIKLATKNFTELIGRGGFGRVYRGKVTDANGVHFIAAKRLDKSRGQAEQGILTELQILLEYKHENIIGLVGYCNEINESIIVYDYASRGSLDTHLKDNYLTWKQRLEICINIASGLHFLHGGSQTKEVVIHRDIKSANILLADDWKAKICDFGLSLRSSINKDMDFVIDNACGTFNYCDPLYMELGSLTQESDIYSLGVVLVEILCGRLISENKISDFRFVINSFKRQCEKGKLDNEMVFEGIRAQIAPNSLAAFQMIAYECLQRERGKRPTAGEMLLRLKKALIYQEDHEMWEPRLPKDYMDIIQMSNHPEIYFTSMKKDLYNMLSKGILIQQGKVMFTLNSNGARNEMISAETFSYINRCLHKWPSIQESRFRVVAEMLDILNLKIKIKTRTHLLSPNVVYGVYLVFKFSNPRKVSSKPLYVNLKYKNGSKTSHAYFATWRDDEWLMIELCQFSNDKTDIIFKFLLKSFSRYYCRDGNIYVEGLEFQAINDVEHEKIKELKEIQQVSRSHSNMDMLQQLPANREEIYRRSENDDVDEKLFLLGEVNGKKYVMLSIKAALYNISNMKLFKMKVLDDQNRFPEVIELLPQQVFRINCTIKSQMLSQDTDYRCYLVFKLSEKCRGLHCPVKVRDLLHQNNKEVQIIYFRSPSRWNLHDTFRAPEQREDGWMEVQVWNFNFNHELKNDRIRVNLKLISYEGTMSGLILSGLEFRPV